MRKTQTVGIAAKTKGRASFSVDIEPVGTNSNSANGKQTLRRQLADRLRQLREARGWSQDEMATVCGMHRTYISLVERARCNVGVDTVERLAEALGVPPIELLVALSPATLLRLPWISRA